MRASGIAPQPQEQGMFAWMGMKREPRSRCQIDHSRVVLLVERKSAEVRCRAAHRFGLNSFQHENIVPHRDTLDSTASPESALNLIHRLL